MLVELRRASWVKVRIARRPSRATIGAGIRCAWSRELEAAGMPVGRDFLGTRVVAYRDLDGEGGRAEAPIARISAPTCRLARWSRGDCAALSTIGRSTGPAPASVSRRATRSRQRARLFAYPTAEAWGMVWAFNGETAGRRLCREFPGREEQRLPSKRVRAAQGAVSTPDRGFQRRRFQHLRHCTACRRRRIAGTARGRCLRRPRSSSSKARSTFSMAGSPAQRLRPASAGRRQGDVHAVQWHAGRAGLVEPATSSSACRRAKRTAAGGAGMVDRSPPRTPVLRSIRFRRGLLTASDRHLARYLGYVEEFPGSCRRRPRRRRP